jgi:hypothetical protein
MCILKMSYFWLVMNRATYSRERGGEDGAITGELHQVSPRVRFFRARLTLWGILGEVPLYVGIDMSLQQLF